MSKRTPYKGGRNERIEARITHEAKIALLARVDREGFGSFADWLEAQAMPQLTQRGADSLKAGRNLPAKKSNRKGIAPA